MTSPKPEEPLPLTDMELAELDADFDQYGAFPGKDTPARLRATIAHHKARADALAAQVAELTKPNP